MTTGCSTPIKIIAISGILAACVVLRIDSGVYAAESHQNQQKPRQIDLKGIKNAVVRRSLEAWQRADRVEWVSLFAPGARLLDDGSPRDLQAFGTEAIGEGYYTDVTHVEDGGLTVIGHFHTKKYGDFIARFHFVIDAAKKIQVLDISRVHGS